MAAKLILKKTSTGFYLWRNPLDKSQELLGATVPIMNDNGVDLRGYELSLKNCQAIENGYDLDELDKLAREWYVQQKFHGLSDTVVSVGYLNMFKAGFQKALEILGDKKFSEEDMRKAYFQGDYDALYDGAYSEKENKFIKSLQQTEWEVEILMEEPLVAKSRQIHGEYVASKIIESAMFPKPLLDADGCLILKRKV